MTTTSPVTILMTAYNRQAYIGAAIESVLAQTFTDFQLLVVDDASTDATVQVAERYLSDKRVRVVRNEKNLGQFQNRNYALSLADTPFVKFQDSDDVMYPHALETLYRYLASAPAAGFALSGTWSGGPCPMILTPRMAYEREFLGTGMFNGGPSNALFRSEVIKSLGGFPLMGVPSDYVFWVIACARVGVVLVPGDLQWYRIHPGQELQAPHAIREQSAAREFAWEMLKSSQCPLSESDRATAKANYIYTLVRQAFWDVRSGHPSRAARILFHSGVSLMEWPLFLRRRARNPLAGTPIDDEGQPLMPNRSAGKG